MGMYVGKSGSSFAPPHPIHERLLEFVVFHRALQAQIRGQHQLPELWVVGGGAHSIHGHILSGFWYIDEPGERRFRSLLAYRPRTLVMV